MISFLPVQVKDHPKGYCFILPKPIINTNNIWCANYEWLIGITIRVNGLLYKVRSVRKSKPSDKTIEVMCDRDKVTPNNK